LLETPQQIEARPEAQAKAIGIGDREIAQAVVSIGDWFDHPRADLLRDRPIPIDIRHHDAHVGLRLIDRGGQARPRL
jgi:hypothetical protein